MSTNQDDLIHSGSVKLWHPRQDKPGMPYSSMRLEHGTVFNIFEHPTHTMDSAESCISTLCADKLYCFCNDILAPYDIPYIDDLLVHFNKDSHKPDTFPYLSRTGGVAALRTYSKKRNGFLIPASGWQWQNPPDKHFLENMIYIYGLFGFQAVTPASLSEKILRSTLDEHVHISRPSIILRDSILQNSSGGRIDKAELGILWPVAVEYDKNKAYLHHSRNVPSPFHAPTSLVMPKLQDIERYPTGWYETTLVARFHRIPPIQINGRRPEEGEVITRWLWRGEIEDALSAGYQLVEIRKGFGFRAMSDFMCKWTDILYEKYQYILDTNPDPHILAVIKSMMVGLPGRFLRRPEVFRLVHLRECQKGDIPLNYQWNSSEGPFFSDYCIRAEYDENSTALSPIGAYIVAEMRRELYHQMLKEELSGNTVIRSYIDCFATACISSEVDLGTGLGQYKEKAVYWNAYAEENRFVGRRIDTWEYEMRAPGMGGTDDSGRMSNARQDFWARYYQMLRDWES